MSFRTTAELRDKINDAAKSSGRSVAQELEWRLEKSFLTDQTQRLKELEKASRDDRLTIGRLTELLMAARDEYLGKSGQDRVAPPVNAAETQRRFDPPRFRDLAAEFSGQGSMTPNATVVTPDEDEKVEQLPRPSGVMK